MESMAATQSPSASKLRPLSSHGQPLPSVTSSKEYEIIPSPLVSSSPSTNKSVQSPESPLTTPEGEIGVSFASTDPSMSAHATTVLSSRSPKAEVTTSPVESQIPETSSYSRASSSPEASGSADPTITTSTVPEAELPSPQFSTVTDPHVSTSTTAEPVLSSLESSSPARSVPSAKITPTAEVSPSASLLASPSGASLPFSGNQSPEVSSSVNSDLSPSQSQPSSEQSVSANLLNPADVRPSQENEIPFVHESPIVNTGSSTASSSLLPTVSKSAEPMLSMSVSPSLLEASFQISPSTEPVSLAPTTSPTTGGPSATDSSLVLSPLPDGSPLNTEGDPSLENTPMSSVTSQIPTPSTPVPSMSALVSPIHTNNVPPSREAATPSESVSLSSTFAFEISTSAEVQVSTASPSSIIETPAAEGSHYDGTLSSPDMTPSQIVGSESAGVEPSVAVSPSPTVRALRSPDEVPSSSAILTPTTNYPSEEGQSVSILPSLSFIALPSKESSSPEEGILDTGAEASTAGSQTPKPSMSPEAAKSIVEITPFPDGNSFQEASSSPEPIPSQTPYSTRGHTPSPEATLSFGETSTMIISPSPLPKSSNPGGETSSTGTPHAKHSLSDIAAPSSTIRPSFSKRPSGELTVTAEATQSSEPDPSSETSFATSTTSSPFTGSEGSPSSKASTTVSAEASEALAGGAPGENEFPRQTALYSEEGNSPVGEVASPELVPSIAVSPSHVPDQGMSGSVDMSLSPERSQSLELSASSNPSPSRSPTLEPALSEEMSPSIGLNRSPEQSVRQSPLSVLVSPSSDSSLALEPSDSSSDMQAIERSESPILAPSNEPVSSQLTGQNRPSSMIVTPESSQVNGIPGSQSLEVASSSSTELISPDPINSLHSDASPETSMGHGSLQPTSSSAVPDMSHSSGVLPSVLPTPSSVNSPRISSSPSRKAAVSDELAVVSPSFTLPASGDYEDISPTPQREQSTDPVSSMTIGELSKGPSASESVFPEPSSTLPEPTLTPSIPSDSFTSTPFASISSMQSSQPEDGSFSPGGGTSKPSPPEMPNSSTNSIGSGISEEIEPSHGIETPFETAGSAEDIADKSQSPTASAGRNLRDTPTPGAIGSADISSLPPSMTIVPVPSMDASESINVEASPSHVGISATPSVDSVITSIPSRSSEVKSPEPPVHESASIPISDLNPKVSESALASSSVIPSVSTSAIAASGAELSTSSPSVSKVNSPTLVSLSPSNSEDQAPSPTVSAPINGVTVSPLISSALPSPSELYSGSPAVSGGLVDPSPSFAESPSGSSDDEVVTSPVFGTPTASVNFADESLVPSSSKSSPSPSLGLPTGPTAGSKDPFNTSSPDESPDNSSETNLSPSPLTTPTASAGIGSAIASPSTRDISPSPILESTSDVLGGPGGVINASPSANGIPGISAEVESSPSLTSATPMVSVNMGSVSTPASMSGISPSPTLRPTSEISDISESGTDASPTLEGNPSSSEVESPLPPSFSNLLPSPHLGEGIISPGATETPPSHSPESSHESSLESMEPLHPSTSDGGLFSSPLLDSPSATATVGAETVAPPESGTAPSPLPESVFESPTDSGEPVYPMPSDENSGVYSSEELSSSPQFDTPAASEGVNVESAPPSSVFQPSPSAESAVETSTESTEPFYSLSSEGENEVDSDKGGGYPSPQLGVPTPVLDEETAKPSANDVSNSPWEEPTLEPVLESMVPSESSTPIDTSGLGAEEVLSPSVIPEISPRPPEENLSPSINVGTPYPSSLVGVSDEIENPENPTSSSTEVPDNSLEAEVPTPSMPESFETLPSTAANSSPSSNGIAITPDDQDFFESAEPSFSSASTPGLATTMPNKTPSSVSVSPIIMSTEFSPEPSLAVSNGSHAYPSESPLPSPVDTTMSPSPPISSDPNNGLNSLMPSTISGNELLSPEPFSPSPLLSSNTGFGSIGPSFSASMSSVLRPSASPSRSMGLVSSSTNGASSISGKGTPSPGVDPLANADVVSGNGGETDAPSGNGLPGGAGGVSGIAIGSLFVILVVGSVLYKTCAVFPEGSGFTIGSIFGGSDEGDGKGGWMAGAGSELDDSPWDQVWRSASELPEKVVAAGEAAANLVGGEFAGLLKPGAARVRPPQVITRLAVPGMCMALSQLSPGSSDVFSTMSGHSSESRSFRSSRFPSSQQNFKGNANATNEESAQQSATGGGGALKVDLLFVFDASGSLSWREYRRLKEILTRPGGLIDNVMKNAHNGSRTGFIEYAYDSVVVSELDRDEEAVRRRILSSFQGDANNWDKDGMYIYEVGEEVGGNALRKVDSLVERNGENVGLRNGSMVTSEGDIEEPPIVQAKEVPPAMNGMSREAHLALKWSRFEMLPPVANKRIQEQLQNALRLRRIVVINAGELTKGGQSEYGVDAAMDEKREIESAGIRIMTLGIGEEREKDLSKLATGKYHLIANSVEGVTELIPRLTEMILKMDARHDRKLSRNALAIIKRKRRKRDRSAREKRQQAVYRAMQAGAIDPVKSISKGLPRRASELPPWFTQ